MLVYEHGNAAVKVRAPFSGNINPEPEVYASIESSFKGTLKPPPDMFGKRARIGARGFFYLG